MTQVELWIVVGAATVAVISPIVAYLRTRTVSEVTALDVATDSVVTLLAPLNTRIDELHEEISELKVEIAELKEQLRLERKEREWHARHNAALVAQLQAAKVVPITFDEVVNLGPTGKIQRE